MLQGRDVLVFVDVSHVMPERMLAATSSSLSMRWQVMSRMSSKSISLRLVFSVS